MEHNDDGLVRVGILGCGNVGTALVRLLDANADLITRRSGVRIEVVRVAVQNLTKERAGHVRARCAHQRRRAASSPTPTST